MLDEQQELRNASALPKHKELMSGYSSLADHLEAVVSWAKQQGIGLDEAFGDSFASSKEYFFKYKEQIREALAKALADQNAKTATSSTTRTKLEELLASGEIVLPSNIEFTEALQVLENQAVHEGSFGYLNEQLPPAKGFVPTKSKKNN